MTCQIEIGLGRFLSFFNEPMQQDRGIPIDEENNAGDPRWEPRPYLPKTVAHASDERFADWPAILHLEHIVTDNLAFLAGQGKQPVADRLDAMGCPEESRVKFPGDISHLYQFLYVEAMEPCDFMVTDQKARRASEEGIGGD